VREQRVALEHDAGAALVRRQRVDHAVADPHRALGLPQQPGDDPQQRGLAAAARAEQRDELARADPQATSSTANASP
jgi:hypothetical protein